ncbi:MAG TPA: PD-(D/E)XK nuclease family protein [Gammaproteobacteria bacterium]
MTTIDHADRLLLVPYGADPLAAIAERLLQDHAAALPRLEQAVVLLPDIEAAPRLRRLLLQQAAKRGHQALLGPQITTWPAWLNAQAVACNEVAGNHHRELILVEALRKHATLFGQGNLWALADSLITLFDELTLNRVGLPRDLAEFIQRVGEGYGMAGTTLQGLEQEARMVHTLWHAWHQELHQRELIDRNTRYLLQLAETVKSPPAEQLYLAAPAAMSEAEREWAGEMLERGRLTLLLHGQLSGPPSRLYHPETPLYRLVSTLRGEVAPGSVEDAYSRMLDTIYNPAAVESAPLRERALAFAQQQPQSPAGGRLQLLSLSGDEEEAHAVELQVRSWLLHGRQRVGIVTENRRLARRVRALLERAGVTLEDAAGWALSTTSAAAVLERWLECVEEDFPQLAMLDLLKSPFFSSELPREEHLNRVYRLEQDIIQRENIAGGMARYRRHLHYRQQRLPGELAAGLEPLAQLLTRLESARAPLQPLREAGSSPAAAIIEALQASLGALGLDRTLAADAAGLRLLEELEQMLQAVRTDPVSLSWLEFRSWFGRTLERFNFRPPSSGHAVTLLGLGQTGLADFDALIIAGAEREHLPGAPATTPFFNDAVRRQLGLPAGDEQMAVRFYHFRRLLESAPQILLTCRRQQDGEEVQPSPWLEALRAFHRLAYGDELHAAGLADLLAHPMTQVVNREAPLPPPDCMPAPAPGPALLPQSYSASAYQQLIDCPYQFYAARCLSLAPPEAVREALEKSDYGERVHRCLQAFHGDVPELPGPFSGRLTAARRDEAESLLRRISQAVFAADLEDNFLHRGWLQRWLDKIPLYLDWQMEREERWRVAAVEQKATQSALLPGITLQGRLDRIDSDGPQHAIVDYKTGHIPRVEEVECGEAVQLPFYALLAGDEMAVNEVSYLALDQEKVTNKVTLEDEALQELSQGVGERLAAVVSELQAGGRLPAWGDEKSCGFCPMAGVCRRQAWQNC